MFGLMLGLIPQEEAGEDTCWIEAQGRPLSHRPYNRQHRGRHKILGHFDWLLLFTVTGKVKSSASANLMLKFENISSLD